MILQGRLEEYPAGENLEAAPGFLPAVIKHSRVMPGENPGAALGLLEAVLTRAALSGRTLVGPDDVYHAAQIYGEPE